MLFGWRRGGASNQSQVDPNQFGKSAALEAIPVTKLSRFRQ
jgi:hypothetical protein